MEALVKVPEKTRANRRRNHPNTTTSKLTKVEKSLELSPKDYDDFIEIKKNNNTRYREQSIMFFYIGLAISLFFITVAFNWKFYDDGSTVNLLSNEGSVFEEVHNIPLTEQQPPPPPQVLKQLTIVEVADEIILEEVNMNLDVEMTEDMAVEEIIFDTELEEEVAEEIFYIVENQPQPVGGYEAFYEFVGKNLVYPRMAVRMRVEGRVYVRFIVGKDGAVTEAKVVKGISELCDAEALRVINMIPNWSPGSQRGKPVRVYMTIPIIYKLQKSI